MDHKPLSQINDQSFPASSSHEHRIHQLKEEIAALKAENQRLKQLIMQRLKRQQQEDSKLDQSQQLLNTIIDEWTELQEKIIKYQKESAERQNKILETQKESAERQNKILETQKEFNQMLKAMNESLSSGFIALIKTTLTGNLFTMYKEMVKKTKKW